MLLIPIYLSKWSLCHHFHYGGYSVRHQHFSLGIGQQLSKQPPGSNFFTIVSLLTIVKGLISKYHPHYVTPCLKQISDSPWLSKQSPDSLTRSTSPRYSALKSFPALYFTTFPLTPPELQPHWLFSSSNVPYSHPPQAFAHTAPSALYSLPS